MTRALQDYILNTLRGLSTPERPIYLVGGAVRDLLLDRPVHDMDFAVSEGARQLAKMVADTFHGAFYVLDDERETMRVVLDEHNLPGGYPGKHLFLDFATFRNNDLDGDLWARDFTINAMALDISRPEHLIDPTGGLKSLQTKTIQTCTPTSILKDPVRVLRAVRMAVELDFRIEPETLRIAREGVVWLPRISTERLRDELFKILGGPKVSLAIRLLDRWGALRYVLPELEGLKEVTQSVPHVMDVWEHTLSTVRYLEQLFGSLVGTYAEEKVTDWFIGTAVLWLGRFRNHFEAHYRKQFVIDRTLRSLLFLSVLYHDIEKPTTRQALPDGKIRFLEHQEKGASTVRLRGKNLALSVNEIDRLAGVVKNHMRVHQLNDIALSSENRNISRRAIYRFFKDVGEAGVDICLLSLADTRGTYGVTLPQDLWLSELETCRILLEAYWEKTIDIVSPPRLISGEDIIQRFNLKPGREIGQILAVISEMQAAGEINNREEAFAYAQAWLMNKSNPNVT